MRNYCGKCGARIDPQTGLCPRCEMPKPRRRRGKYLWIPAAALLVIAAAALLWTQGWLPRQGQAAEDETAPPEQEIAAPVTEPPEQESSEPVTELPEQEEQEPAEADEAEVVEETALPADLPAQFTFASGAGGWWTELTLQPDGSFTGQYIDWNLGGVMPEMEAEAGEPLPNGQCYRCDFTGTFGSIRKVSDVEYALVLTDLTCAQEPGTHAVIDGAWIDYTEPNGLEGGEEFRLYLPGRSTADFSESLQSWLRMPAALDEMPDPLDRWCLYNVATDSGFYSAPVEAGPAQPQSAAEIWEVFVENRDYDVYLNDWNLEVAAPTGYALADLNGDGWEELVLYGEQNFDPGFANHSVFVCDRETLTVTLLPIATAFASEGGYDTVGQSYGGIRYDPAYHALVYTEMRNGSRFGYYSFWTLEAGKVSASQSLHFEQDEGGTYHYTWHDGGTAQEITQEEFSSRLGDNYLTFTPLPEAS